MKATKLLPALAAAALCAAPAMAQQAADGAPEPIVRTISATTGTFDGTGTWHQTWTGNGDSPRVILTASRKDMASAANGTGLDLREGTSKSSTYVISTEGAWRVSGFDVTMRANNAAYPVALSCGARQYTVTADADTRLTMTDLDEFASASFTLQGDNQGVTTSDFTVTLTPVTPEAYTEVSLDMASGTFTGGTWKSLWENADGADPKIYLSCKSAAKNTVVSNMAVAANGTDFDLREGSDKSANYLLSTAGSHRISGFRFTFVSQDADNPVTVTAGSTTLTSTTEPQTIEVKDLAYGAKALFTLAGNNKGISVSDFKVYVSDASPLKRGVNVFTYTGYLPYSTVYRIPVLAHIDSGEHAGRLVAINDFRPCGSDIGYGEVDLHIATSDNKGYTWTMPADLVDANGNHVADGDGKGTPQTSNENRDCGFGDPALVADRETGDLLLMGVCGRIPIGQATREIPQGLATWTSHDGGRTWSQWKDITEEILTQLDDNCEYGKVDGLFFTAGRMVQSKYVKVGSHYRVYVVGGGRSASIPDTQCWVFYTDDFGQNWHILGDPYKPALTTGGSEPKCEELPDGSLVYSGRAGGGRTFNVFTYTDYATGQGAWDTAVFSRMVTGAASCNGDALIVPVANTETGATAYLLMQSIPQASSRVNVGVNFKVLDRGFDDFGSAEAIATGWDGSYQVTNMGSAYSSLALLADGTIGFIYEESTFGCDYTEVYRHLTVEQITGGAYAYAPDTDCATALRLTRELVEGKLQKAHADYDDKAERTELLAALDGAASAFSAAPSTESYLDFNRALADVKAGKVQTGITAVGTESHADAPVYDLQGRRVKKMTPGSLYLQAGRKILKK